MGAAKQSRFVVLEFLSRDAGTESRTGPLPVAEEMHNTTPASTRRTPSRAPPRQRLRGSFHVVRDIDSPLLFIVNVNWSTPITD